LPLLVWGPNYSHANSEINKTKNMLVMKFSQAYLFLHTEGEETQKVISLTLALKMEIRQNMRKRLFGAKMAIIRP